MHCSLFSAKCIATIALSFMTVLATGGTPVSASDGRLQALVIGNGNYSTGQLRNPVNDATAMTRALQNLDFDVTQLTDVNQQQAEDAVFEFSRKVKKDGLAFFFFAGHGVQVKGENYLIPTDAKIREEYEVRHQCISLSLVLDALENSGSNMNVVVLDCCRDNPFQRSWSRSSRAGLAATSEIPEGTLIAYATSPGATAADGDGTNSPYTLELTKALSQRPETGLLLRDAFFEASRNVKKTTGQSPWINMEASLSKFYLSRPLGEGAAAVAEATSRPPSAASNPASNNIASSVASVSPTPSNNTLPPLPGALPTESHSAPSSNASPFGSLERQANIYLGRGDYTNAIEAFSAIISDSSLSADVRRRSRKARGSAYLSRGGKSDLDRAIIDYKAAGLPGIRVAVQTTSSPLKVGNETKGTVHRNQILLVTLSNGNWLWVKSINDDESINGYVAKEAVIRPEPTVAKAPTTSPTVSKSQTTLSQNAQGQYIPAQGQVTSQGRVIQGQGNVVQGTYPQQGQYVPPTQPRYPVQGSTQQGQQQYYPSQSNARQPTYSNQSSSSNTRQMNTSQNYNQRSTPSRFPSRTGGRKTFSESFNESYNKWNRILNGGRR